MTNEYREDAEAMEEAAVEMARLGGKQRPMGSSMTRANRYENSIAELSKIASKQKGESVVLHIIGVGGGGAPQAVEAIRAIMGSGKPLEVHLMDISPELLKVAVERAKREFPGVKIASHHMDLALPLVAPVRRADIAVCTNVMLHISPWHHSALGLQSLSSFMKPGGYALVDHSDLNNDVVELKELGLEISKSVRERHSSDWAGIGVILRKRGEPMPFHGVWGRIKEKKKVVRERALRMVRKI